MSIATSIFLLFNAYKRFRLCTLACHKMIIPHTKQVRQEHTAKFVRAFLLVNQLALTIPTNWMSRPVWYLISCFFSANFLLIVSILVFSFSSLWLFVNDNFSFFSPLLSAIGKYFKCFRLLCICKFQVSVTADRLTISVLESDCLWCKFKFLGQ